VVVKYSLAVVLNLMLIFRHVSQLTDVLLSCKFPRTPYVHFVKKPVKLQYIECDMVGLLYMFSELSSQLWFGTLLMFAKASERFTYGWLVLGCALDPNCSLHTGWSRLLWRNHQPQRKG